MSAIFQRSAEDVQRKSAFQATPSWKLQPFERSDSCPARTSVNMLLSVQGEVASPAQLTAAIPCTDYYSRH